MKISVERDTLLRPLQLVGGVVERRQTMAILGHVLLVADEGRLTATATDLEVEISAEAEVPAQEPGRTTVPARKLLDICRALPEGSEITLVAEGERVTVRSGRSRFVLAALAPDTFPTMERLEAAQTLEVPQALLRELIERTHFSMAHQDVRYYLNGMLLEVSEGRLAAVATDGHRLACCERAVAVSSPGTQQVIVPRKAVSELLRVLGDGEEPATLELGTNHLRVLVPGVRFTAKLIDGRYPDYRRVIPPGGERHLTADREALREALGRASILSNEKYRGVRLQMEDGTLRIQAHNPEQEEAEEELEVRYQGGPLTIGFNVGYLLDVLSALPGETVEASFTDANSSCLITAPGAEGCRYVVMPMRL